MDREIQKKKVGQLYLSTLHSQQIMIKHLLCARDQEVQL